MNNSRTVEENAKAAVPVKCGACAALQQTPFACEDCHELLAHVQGADYFELFGLPRTYDLDLNLLEEKYLRISRNIHPDKFATAGEEMQAFALRAYAAINGAYDVLRDPLHRAEYILEAAGGKSAAQDKRVPPELLNEVMMLREEIEEAKAGGDAAAIESVRARVTDRRQRTQERISTLCGELSTGSETSKSELRLRLNTMKYLNNLLTQT